MSNKKIIFLDIDGVLNSVRSAIAFQGYPSNQHHHDKFDDVAVGLIRDICNKTGAFIILSSTWRLFEGWEDLAMILQLPIVDRTPKMLTSTRGEEISMWLRDNTGRFDEYVIIDDDVDMLDYQKSRFVKTDGHEGFSYKNYLKVLKLFKYKKVSKDAL